MELPRDLPQQGVAPEEPQGAAARQRDQFRASVRREARSDASLDGSWDESSPGLMVPEPLPDEAQQRSAHSPPQARPLVQPVLAEEQRRERSPVPDEL